MSGTGGARVRSPRQAIEERSVHESNNDRKAVFLLAGLLLTVFTSGFVLAQTPVGPTTGVSSWPQVVVHDSRVHVVYAFDTIPESLPQIYVATAALEDSAFSNPVRVAAKEGGARRPAAAVGPNGHIHVVWAEVDHLLQTSRLRFARSTDGQAKSFTSPGTIGESGVALNPRIAFDDGEAPVIVWESGAPSVFERQIRFGRLRDAGVAGVRNLSTSGPVSAPNITFADGALHVVWRQITENQGAVFYSRSTDRGETWSTPVVLPGTATTTAPQDDFLPLFETGPNSVGLLLRDASRHADRILFLYSLDRGASFSNPVAVAGVNAPAAVTAGLLARYGAREGRLAALWIAAPAGGEAADQALHISCTTNPGQFSDSRRMIELAGGVRELSAASDASGEIRAALVQTINRNSKVIYITGRCPPRVLTQHIVNAASQAPGAVAPGGLATAYGMDLGGAAGFTAAIDPKTGYVTTQLGSTLVTLDGVTAPLLYAGRDQVNFQVPYEIAGKTSAQLVVTVNGISSDEIQVPVVAASPAFFTLDRSGSGPVVAANQDYTFNLPANPAPGGTYVVLYATGAGVVSPPVATGQLGPAAAPFPQPGSTLTVSIGGRPTEVAFGGIAPYYLGLLQINVKIPTGLSPGPQPIRLQIGTHTSVAGTTIFVR
jgi:uncharacterized protein (TIGR03437 family)